MRERRRVNHLGETAGESFARDGGEAAGFCVDSHDSRRKTDFLLVMFLVMILVMILRAPPGYRIATLQL